ncbi:DNA repair protein RecO [Alcaligenaceae bacterium CGII-47]|nr:DNA repair protein RecO [Alcaligenaceae bacterium CGII-47]
MSRRPERIQDVRGYVLHTSAWRETSLIVQGFTRDYGCVALAAKGAKRPYSVLRPILVAFQPVFLSWSGAGEVKTLIRAETEGVRLLNGRAMMSAWYMNELILRLLAREDPHPGVFDAYEAALLQLMDQQHSPAGALRRFEWVLLDETGYGQAGAAPDFDDPQAEPMLRLSLRDRLDALLESPLHTRKILMDLQRY